MPFRFGPPKFVFEINYHDIEFRFRSTFKLFENPFLVRFHLFDLDQNRGFEQFESESKTKFDQVIIYSKSGPKVKRHAYGSKIGPPHIIPKPSKAMQQYLKRKTIKSSVRDCIAAMPDNPACYQLVFGDDYFWS